VRKRGRKREVGSPVGNWNNTGTKPHCGLLVVNSSSAAADFHCVVRFVWGFNALNEEMIHEIPYMA
jgi:hypothetical protein